MQFSNEALDELRAIYRDDLHLEITRDQAAEIGARVVGLLQLLLRPVPRRPSEEPTED